MTALPSVRHAVTVRIGLHVVGFEFRPSRPISRSICGFVIILRIDDAWIISGACAGSCATTRVVDHLLIDPVTVEGSTHIAQHTLVGLLSSMRGDSLVFDRHIHLHGVLGGLGIGVVNRTVIDLVIHAVSPVVLRHIAVLAVDISIHVILSPHVPHQIPLIRVGGVVVRVLRCTNTHCCNAALDGGVALLCGRTYLVVVVHHVHIHAFTSVATIASPIVDDIVAEVHAFVGLCAWTRTETRCARFVVRNEVVMIGSARTAPVASIAVCSLGVSCILQTLRSNAPLHGEVLGTIDREALVDAPADGTMVDDDVL